MTLSVSDWQSAWTAFAILAMFYIQSYVFLRVYICGMRDGENKSMWTYEENKDLSLPTMSAKFMTSSISLSLRFFLHLCCCLFLGRFGRLWKLPELFLLRRRKSEILIPIMTLYHLRSDYSVQLDNLHVGRASPDRTFTDICISKWIT